jgi:hypothetical protein
MEYMQAHEIATMNKVPVRRTSWPQGHHAVHVAENRWRLHTDHPTPQDWVPSEADQNAKDWEQHVPPHQA